MSHCGRSTALHSGNPRFHEGKLHGKHPLRQNAGIENICRQIFFIHGLMARYLIVDTDSGAQMS